MISMPINHPDIEEFIDVKTDLKKVTKANISVRVDDKFMSAVKQGLTEYELLFVVEDTGEVIKKTIDPMKLFKRLATNNWNYAEPGMLFWDKISNWHIMSEDPTFEFAGVNPCFTGDMRLLTEDGYKRFDELVGQTVRVVNKDGEISEGKVWSSGTKGTVKVKVYRGQEITCTPDHVFMTSDGREVQAKDLKGERLKKFVRFNPRSSKDLTKYGFIQGDGQLTRLASKDHNGIEVNIGQKDGDIYELFEGENYTISGSGRAIYLKGHNDTLRELGFSQETLPARGLPTAYSNWSLQEKAEFLQGCFSANGSVIRGHRIAYKTTSATLRDELMETLNTDFNLGAYFTTNKSKPVKFDNGEYVVRESYDVNIGNFQGIVDFAEKINFYHSYKREALQELIDLKSPMVSSVKAMTQKEVFDFSEPLTHWGVVEGVVVHNCAEEPLPAGGSCLLSSINLSEFVKDPFSEEAEFNYIEFEEMVVEAVNYMNDILDENIELLPLESQKKSAEELRQVGIGIMGMADMLIKLNIRYGSQESLELIDKIGFTMANAAIHQSALLAGEFGSFPLCQKDYILKSPYVKANTTPETYDLIKKNGLRNSQLLTIAPTGSISTMLGVSGGVEPIFQVSYIRKSESLHKEVSYYRVITPIVMNYMAAHEIDHEEDLPDVIVTSSNLSYEDRIAVQSAWQKHIDASISSTVNLPKETTVEDVVSLYLRAWEASCKGITIYRDGCARSGILITEDTKREESTTREEIKEVKKGECPNCGGQVNHSGGCQECQDCGWSACSI